MVRSFTPLHSITWLAAPSASRMEVSGPSPMIDTQLFMINGKKSPLPKAAYKPAATWTVTGFSSVPCTQPRACVIVLKGSRSSEPRFVSSPDSASTNTSCQELGRTINSAVSGSDQWPSSSLTRNEITCVPIVRCAPWRIDQSSETPSKPFRFETHSYQMIVPSSTVRPCNSIVSSPRTPRLGEMNSITAIGS